MWSILVSMSLSSLSLSLSLLSLCAAVCREFIANDDTSVCNNFRVARKYEQRRRAEKQAETRRRIVEAAIELHGKKGPGRTTMSDVARLAGVERRTLYRHF